MDLLATVFAFAFGTVVGSFLNVVIWRVPREASIVFPASHCPSCKTSIAWYYNVPILSWVWLKGRCRHCGAPIDARYPVVELLTGLLAVACVNQLGLTWIAARSFVFAATLIALTYIDLEHWLLPHAITWPGIAVGLATAWIPGAPGLLDAGIGAGAGFAAFALLRLVGTVVFRREAMGGGDLFLFAMIGAFLGWQALLPVVFLASVQGSVVGLGLIALGRGEPGPDEPEEPEGDEEADEEAIDDEDEEREDDWTPPRFAVPFGPFLALGALEMLFAGDAIVGLFWRWMGIG